MRQRVQKEFSLREEAESRAKAAGEHLEGILTPGDATKGTELTKLVETVDLRLKEQTRLLTKANDDVFMLKMKYEPESGRHESGQTAAA